MQNELENRTFSQRLDFYWQSISIYAVILVAYSLFRGTLNEGELNFYLDDPIVELLALFILGSFTVYMYKFLWLRVIEVGDDYIIFKNRFNSNKYNLDDIEDIYIGSERPFQSRNTYRVIKIKFKDKKRKIRIRPYNYWDDKLLYNQIKHLKAKL